MNKKKKMNLWIFNHYALPPSIPGGTRHYDISRELVKNNHSVTIFAASFHYNTLEDFKTYDKNFFIEENINGINFVWFKTIPYKSNGIARLRNMISYNLAVRKYLKTKKLEKPDIIIGSTVHLFAVNLAYNISKKYKSKFFVEVRDFWPYTLVALGKMSKYHPLVLLFSYLEKKLYKKAEKVITLFDKGYLYLNKFIPNEKIILIPNSFNTDILQNLKETEKLDKEYFNVVYSGTVGVANDVMTLIQSAKYLKDNKKIRINIIGEGKEKEMIIEYCTKNNVENIVFYSQVTKNELIPILQKASVLWVGLKDSILYEFGFSMNKVYDYMASKVPIIISTSVENNIIDQANCGKTIEPESPEILAETIIEFYNKPEVERKILGENGFNFLMDNITTQSVAKNLINELQVS
jgi:glycosyltransferase involved in cell wall biosynthesis